jgi:NAD(P)-dependent dehydrogenase (short-subunit alcohol dehydrogenase family)
MQLRGSSVIVTGGASGLGAACATLFGEAGARVAIFDVDTKRGPEMAAACGGRFEHVDVCDDAAIGRALDATAGAHGAPRILVNTAGIGGGGIRIASKRGPHPRDMFERMFAVHALGTFNVMRLCAERMIAAAPLDDGERGVVINTSSIAASDAPVGMVAYAAAKGAIEAMTLPAARDLAPAGIRVACIAAGSFETPMLGAMTEDMRARALAYQPHPKRFGAPSEFAALARHICENHMINGTVMRLDGGARLNFTN